MFDYGSFKYRSKVQVIEKSIRFLNPDKTRFWKKGVILDLEFNHAEGAVTVSRVRELINV